MGKTVTSHTWGNSLESIKGAELPQRFIFGLCTEKMEPGRGQEKPAAASVRGSSPVSCQQRGCGCAALCPMASWPSRVFTLIKSTGLQASRPWFGVMTRCRLGRGGHRMAASPALPRTPCVILGGSFPALGLRSPLLAKENQCSSAF